MNPPNRRAPFLYMQILFGADNDGLHISPHDPGGYEWWYFDAVSDDERFVLVVIFFLGTPMSPYYKAVADGKAPVPNDWCGVFVTLHERTRSGYRERAYAYNVYRGGRFAPDGASVAVGGSGFVREKDTWSLSLFERGLWRGAVRGNLSFAADFLPNREPIPGDAAHTWVCVAPDCCVEGDLTLASRETVRFAGRGYHDHNFGRLPWTHITRWDWNRVHWNREHGGGGAVCYRWDNAGFAAIWDAGGAFILAASPAATGVVTPVAPIQNAPFYQRFSLLAQTDLPPRRGIGIGETFRPAGLTGEIMSRALWTRIRRRSVFGR